MPAAPKSLLEHLPLQRREVERRKALAGVTGEDIARLSRCWPAVQPEVGALVERCLRRQLQTPGVAEFVGPATSHEQMRCDLTRFVESLFSGGLGTRHATSRLRIGFVHRRIGLPARHFLAALHRLQVELRAALAARVPDRSAAAAAAAALERVLLFDESLILDAYEHRLAAEARREHNRALRYASNLEVQVAARTRELEQLTRTDPLTGLRNRRAFLDELPREISRAGRQQRPLAALYIDVDDFKHLNDREGHARGDEALVAVATALNETLREIDVVARLGGDEFCVLLPDTDADAAAAVAARLRARVRDGCPVTVSIGIATLEAGDIADPGALVDRADAAMYVDKGRVPARAGSATAQAL